MNSTAIETANSIEFAFRLLVQSSFNDGITACNSGDFQKHCHQRL